jgi:Methyltransferase domain
LFIDGDHSYNGVVKDFYAYRHLVREGGVIAFHDICMDHRRRFGADTPNDSGEIYLFWKKIKVNYRSAEFYVSEDQNGAGIGAITWDPNVPMCNYLEK